MRDRSCKRHRPLSRQRHNAFLGSSSRLIGFTPPTVTVLNDWLRERLSAGRTLLIVREFPIVVRRVEVSANTVRDRGTRAEK